MSRSNVEIKETPTGTVAIKTVSQIVKGTAYMKIPGMIMAIHQQGHNRIVLRVNRSHPNRPEIRTQVQFLNRSIPGLELELY